MPVESDLDECYVRLSDKKLANTLAKLRKMYGPGKSRHYGVELLLDAVDREREACAKLAESYRNSDEFTASESLTQIILRREGRTRSKLAYAIRARK